jgi:glucokinase
MNSLFYSIGVDIGGTAIKYGICSSSGDIIEQASVKSPADSPNKVILNKLLEVIKRALDSAKNRGITISAIGVGTPGSVDVKKGYLKGGTPNFKFWREVGIIDFFKDKLILPVFVDNDANLMAYGEYIFGAGKGKRNIVCITLGTGIGGGIVINGEIFRGSFYAGAELGHMTIYYNGRDCNCGGKGCWERYGSASAMVQDYNVANSENPVKNTVEIFERLNSGEKISEKIVNDTIVYISAGIANIIHIFNPEMIIIGGGLSEAGDEFIKKIEATTRQRAMINSAKDVLIRAASLGNRAGLLGAAAFALQMRR